MHGMDPHEEIDYWRERAKRAEAERDELTARLAGAERDALLGPEAVNDCRCAPANQCGRCICPHCQSRDTCLYKWPSDIASQWYLFTTPGAKNRRVCMDCRQTYNP